MADILAEKLSGKDVMGSDGTELGMLYNITMNLRSGELRDLVVRPEEETAFDADFEVDGNGNYRLPARNVRAVKDYIVVDR